MRSGASMKNNTKTKQLCCSVEALGPQSRMGFNLDEYCKSLTFYGHADMEPGKVCC
jgi:hypothetical protein